MHHASPLGKFRGAVVIICLVLILGILGYAYLSDRHTTVLDKDEILNKIETAENNENYSYLSSYIKAYGIGNVNAFYYRLKIGNGNFTGAKQSDTSVVLRLHYRGFKSEVGISTVYDHIHPARHIVYYVSRRGR